MLNTDRFEEFISQYPIYEYRLVDTAEIEEVGERYFAIQRTEEGYDYSFYDEDKRAGADHLQTGV